MPRAGRFARQVAKGVASVCLAVVLADAIWTVGIPALNRWSNAETIHMKIDVSYSGAWNGTYTYGSFSQSREVTVRWSGVGQGERSFTFQGSVADGIGYSVRFQKDDNSNQTMSVAVQADHLGRMSNSTSSSFGRVEFAAEMIS